MAAEQRLEMIHGRGWRRICGLDAIVGALLSVRADMAQIAWVEAHRKRD